MADPAVEQMTDALAAELGQANAQVATPAPTLVEPEPQASVEEPEGEPAGEDLFEGLDRDQLATRLQSQEKSYTELRSLHDRQMNELRENQKTQATTQAQLVEVMQSVATQAQVLAQPAVPERPSQEVYEEWGAKINPEDPEQGAKVAEMMDTMGTGWVTRMEQTLDSRLGNTQAQITALDPEYRQHKGTVDELVKGGMPHENAVRYAVAHASAQPAAQPGNGDERPGRTDTTGRTAPAAQPAVGPINLHPVGADAVRMAAESLGLDGKKFVETQARAVARDHAAQA